MECGRLLQVAEHHRVLPAVGEVLGKRREIPASVQSALRARFQQHCRQSLRLCAELSAILANFERFGIPVLAHKGPILAQRLFGDPAMRQSGDLDFLIRAADVPRAKTALRELGYAPHLNLSPRQEQAFLRTAYEYVFGCGAERNLVEIQWQILPRFYAIDFNMDALFARSVEIRFEGRSARVLGNEDLMLVLCVHAAKHEWSQLVMVRDIARLARMKLDWEWIAAEATRLGIGRIVMTSLLLARDLLRCELAANLKVKDLPVCEKLARRFSLKLRSGEQSSPESICYFRMMMQVRERWRDRARFCFRLALTPSVGDWRAVSLPDRLFPLYHCVRTARLLRRFTVSH